MKILLLILPLILNALTFKVANYNVENLFDLKYSGKEYVEYIPNGRFGWNQFVYTKKLKNISKVIADLNADIIGLEEIESRSALLDLIKFIRKRGIAYRYYAIADNRHSVVKAALLSKFPIKKVIELNNHKIDRSILEVHIDVKGKPLIVFVNHWKSKGSPESERIKYAKVLKKRISSIPLSKEYIIIGDFNSNYNEYITFLKNRKLNDTRGKTGINDILETTKNKKMLTLNEVKNSCRGLYNLWLELPSYERYSYLYKGRHNTMDNMLLPCSMFDGKNIEYVKHSFNVFKPDYLFGKGSIKRWQKEQGYGKFTGEGYSDHLPIYAYFTTSHDRVVLSKKDKVNYKSTTIKSLYNNQTSLNFPLLLQDCVVIYKDKGGAIIKRENDRAIYMHGYNKIVQKGYIYNIVIDGIKLYKGNLEIDKVKDINEIAKEKDITKFYLHYHKGMDLGKKIYINEVLYRLEGRYDRGYLYYDKGRKIRVYCKIRDFDIKNNSYIKLKTVRIINYKGENELIIYYKRQIR